MPIPFQEEKATQAAVRLLDHAGGRMSHMKLIKLLYLADRRSLVETGRPITFDSYVSMKHGPVLSHTLDIVNDEPSPEGPSYWQRHISERRAHEVELITAERPNDHLSHAEEAILDGVFSEFGDLDQWQLRDYCHAHLEEWQDPAGSSKRIRIAEILKAQGLSDEAAAGIVEDLEAEDKARRLLT